jgi:hypothetical protein
VNGDSFKIVISGTIIDRRPLHAYAMQRSSYSRQHSIRLQLLEVRKDISREPGWSDSIVILHVVKVKIYGNRQRLKQLMVLLSTLLATVILR